MAARAIGKYERQCYERHERDLALAAQPGGHPKGFRFIPELGARVVTFIENFCKHHKGEWAGAPLILEEWQRLIITIIFGWVRPDADRPGQWVRRFRTAYIEVARKNGKSLLVSGLGLYLLVADQEPGAEVYSFATKEDQARLLWKEAGKTVAKSERLAKHVKVLANAITFDAAGAVFTPLGSDSETQDGLNPSAGLADELHAHKTGGMWDVIQSGMGARREPLMIAITTAGVYRPESIGWEKHDYAQKVLDGVIPDDAFFAFIAAPDVGDDPFSEIAQQKANPNYGVSVKPGWLRERAEEAKVLPRALNEYLRKHLNIWSQQEKRWISIDKWNACDPAPEPRAERERALRGLSCVGGLDLSAKLDLTAAVFEFETERGYELLTRFWLPEDRAKEEQQFGRSHYMEWAEAGWLKLTPGNVIDYAFIREEILELSKLYNITQLAHDPWGASKLVTELTEEGVQCVECGQGFKSLSEASKEFEASIVAGRLKHGGDPVLRWCANNVVVATDPAGNIKPNKAKAAGKIDGIVAAIMARSRSIVAAPEETYGGGAHLL